MAQLKVTKAYLVEGHLILEEALIVQCPRVQHSDEKRISKNDLIVNLNRSITRKLTPAEMSEKRQKGLCFFCDEKFVVGHKCNTSKQLYLLEVNEDPEPIVEKELVEQEVVEADLEE